MELLIIIIFFTIFFVVGWLAPMELFSIEDKKGKVMSIDSDGNATFYRCIKSSSNTKGECINGYDL